MHVISKSRFREFWERHSLAEKPLKNLYKLLVKANWSSFAEVKGTFPSADQLHIRQNVVTIFNVGGNKYRVIAVVLYHYQRVYIRHVLTHEEYNMDRWKEYL